MTEVNKQEPLIRQARRKLAELFPDDYSVYEKWEQYKEIYASAYRSAPNNMDKIIEYWIDTISPYDHGVHHSELVFPLNVLNNTIATGYGKQHLYDIVRIIAPPQSYAIIYLLWQCNSISNDERLKRAKRIFWSAVIPMKMQILSEIMILIWKHFRNGDMMSRNVHYLTVCLVPIPLLMPEPRNILRRTFLIKQTPTKLFPKVLIYMSKLIMMP